MSNYSKSKSELSMTGAEASGLLHNNFSTTTPPPQLFPCQYKPQQAYFQQAPVLQSTETLVIHYQAINTYGALELWNILKGSLLVKVSFTNDFSDYKYVFLVLDLCN
ncbi:hypothetical protein HanIR_Chr06g0270791 [Helianthus annuus]|nr:hypothetical protein HanIR_Chr06g0270791 [Helianthus annuus]